MNTSRASLSGPSSEVTLNQKGEVLGMQRRGVPCYEENREDLLKQPTQASGAQFLLSSHLLTGGTR